MNSLCNPSKALLIRNLFFARCIVSSTSSASLSRSTIESRRSFFSYRGFIELRKARDKVNNAETKFLQIVKQRRSCQDQLLEAQNTLKEIHSELPTLERGDEKYLELVSREYEAIMVERDMLTKLKEYQKEENAGFASYSSLLAESNARQMARLEEAERRTRLLAAAGLLVGLVGTSLFFNFSSSSEDAADGALTEHEKISPMESLTRAARTQYRQMTLFLSDLQSILAHGDTNLPLKLRDEESPPDIAIDLEGIKRKQGNFDKDFVLVKKLLDEVVRHRDPHNFVQLNSEFSETLEELDGSLEWQIKRDALGKVLLASGTGFVTFAVVYFLLKAVT